MTAGEGDWQQEQLRQIMNCEEDEYEEPVREVEEEQAIITICAPGSSTPYTITLKFMGEIGNIPVCALIDSGSTNSFVNLGIMEQLGLEICKTNPLSVRIADGTMMSTDQLCKGVNFSLQQNEFEADLRVLDVQGYDLILGMDWLSSLGPMFIDWSKGMMKMKSKGRPVSLEVEQVMVEVRVCENIHEIAEE